MKKFTHLGCVALLISFPFFCAIADDDLMSDAPTAPFTIGTLPPELSSPASEITPEPGQEPAPPPAPAPEWPETLDTEDQPLQPSPEPLPSLSIDPALASEPPAEVEPEPKPEPESEPEPQAKAPQMDPRIPRFQQTRPLWGIQITGSVQGIDKTSKIAGSTPLPTIRGASLSAEYNPPFLQSFGVLGLGPSINVYPASSGNGVTSGRLSLYSLGGQIRYQARYFREQPLVPFAGLAVEYWNYSAADGSKGRFPLSGPFVGGMLLLNAIDSDGASAFYSNYGVLRSYLVGELRMLKGGQAETRISGSTLFFGLRIEF